MAEEIFDYTEESEEDLSEVSAIGSDGQFHEHFRFTVEKGHSLLRIDKYLVNCMANISRNRIQDAADAKCILVNGTPVKSNYKWGAAGSSLPFSHHAAEKPIIKGGNYEKSIGLDSCAVPGLLPVCSARLCRRHRRYRLSQPPAGCPRASGALVCH